MPSLTGNKREFVYYPGTPRLQKRAMPPLSGKSYRITAHAVIPESGAQGVIASYGGRETGVPIYLKDDRLVYENNPLHGANTVIASDIRLPRGKVVLAFDRKAQAKEDSYPYHFPSKNGKAVPLLVGAYA